VFLAVFAEVVYRTRRLVSQGVTGFDFAVQEPERVPFQAPPAIGAKFIAMSSVIVPQPFDIPRTAHLVADAVDQKIDVSQSEAPHQLPGYLNHFSIHRRVGVAQYLDPELMVLAETAGLGTFVAEHRAEVIHPDRLREVVHPVFQVGPADGSGALWPQCHAVPAPVFEGIHLFLDDVCTFADGTNE
jgi:hypothetical protein